jgi:hypothetical protein
VYERANEAIGTVKAATLIALVLVLARAQPPEKRSPLILKLTAEDAVVQAGGKIKLRLEVRNGGKSALQIDSGALLSGGVVRDAQGTEMPQWPGYDELCAPPGKEAVWRLLPGGHRTMDWVSEFREETWSGFAPNQNYRGYAMEVGHSSGHSIVAIDRVPTTVTIVWRWSANPEAVKARAHQLGLAPGWSGEVTSNPVEIRLVPALPSK